MNRPPQAEGRLFAWLEDGPSSGPDDGLSSALARARSTRQRPGWLVNLRGGTMETTWRARPVLTARLAFMLLMAALVMALGAVAFTAGGRLSLLPAVAPIPAPIGLAGNGLIAYESQGDIWVADLDATETERQLTTGPALDAIPVWSPDGTKLAYWSREPGSSPSSLVLVDADGSDPLTIVTDPAGQVPWRMDWSPDGRSIAYSLCPDATDPETCSERIFVAATDGSGAAQVGDPELGAARPDWSPDGIRLAFQGLPTDGGPGAYVMAADGTDVRRLGQLPDGADYNAFLVDWSPDGSGIVTQSGSPSDIWFAASDGVGSVDLSPGGADDDGIAWWSPDGAWVAYLSDMNELTVVSADGTERRGLGITRPSGFAWSPDASSLVVMDGTSMVVVDALTGAEGDRWGFSLSRDVTQYPSWQRIAP